MVGLSVGEKHFIQGGIAQDLRTDGRKRLIYRPTYVETGVIAQSNGSAKVEVIASVKAELGRPSTSQPDEGKVSIYVDYSPTAAPMFEAELGRPGTSQPDKGKVSIYVDCSPTAAPMFEAELGRPSTSQPDKGKVSIYVDCSPTAAPMFEGRGGEELSSELSAALQRCLLGGKTGAGAAIDLSSLLIMEGKICWDLYIDGLVVSSDGNLLDALGAAIMAALSNTGLPKVEVAAAASSDEQTEVDVSDQEFLQFDASGVPVIVTLTKVGRHYIVDATSEEESQMSSAVSVSVNRQGHVCGLTKRGGAGLDPSVILDMVSVAKHVSEQLTNKLDSEIAAAEACKEEL